jgi:hypothetical protein
MGPGSISDKELGQVLLNPVELFLRDLPPSITFPDRSHRAIHVVAPSRQPRDCPNTESDDARPEHEYQYPTYRHPWPYAFAPVTHQFTST